jgi:hypothetical protein
MPINCSSNGLLDTLNAKKKELNDNIEALQGKAGAAMEGALATLKAKGDAMKDSLLVAVPVPPAIPNFKKELDALKGKVGKELADAKAAFKERWGDALPDIDIDGLMDKVSAAKSLVDNFDENLNDLATGLAGKVADKFDFCKDVPNIEAPKVSPEGKVEVVKVKAEEPIVAADIPKKVEVVVPTVVEKEKAPSVKPTVTVSSAELANAKSAMRREIDFFLREFRTKKSEAADLMARAKIDTKAWDKIRNDQRNATVNGLGLMEYYNTGQGRKGYQILIKNYLISKVEAEKWNTIIQACLTLNRAYAAHGTGDRFQETLQNYKANLNRFLEEVVEDGKIAQGTSVLTLRTVTGYDSTLQAYADILVKHATIIEQIESYRNA